MNYSKILAILNFNVYDVNAAAQSCYDPTNTQTLATRTAAGETNGPSSSAVSGGIVTCSATNGSCGVRKTSN